MCNNWRTSYIADKMHNPSPIIHAVSLKKPESLLNQNNNLFYRSGYPAHDKRSQGRIECDLKSWPCQVILALLGNSRGPLPHTTDTLIHLRVPRTFSTHSSMPRKLYEHSMAPARSFHSVLPARSLHAPAAPCTLAALSGLFLHTMSDSACSGFSILL